MLHIGTGVLVSQKPASSMRPKGPERESHDMLHMGTGVLVSQANAPTKQGIGISEEHLGEVQRVNNPMTEKGATSEFSYIVQGSDGTVDQFWQTEEKPKTTW